MKTMLAVGMALLGLATPAFARGEKVALLPATVVKGAAGNSAVVTDALRMSLEKRGFRVMTGGQVTKGVDTSRILTIKNLGEIRRSTGADFVVYPRVLSVGVGVNSQEYQATILVNVAGKSDASPMHTRQVAQVFKPRVPEEGKAVLNRGDADEAAGKLLDGFYQKVK